MRTSLVEYRLICFKMWHVCLATKRDDPYAENSIFIPYLDSPKQTIIESASFYCCDGKLYLIVLSFLVVLLVLLTC